MVRKKKTESEKKRYNAKRQRRFHLKKVNLGEEIDRWNGIKSAISATSDAEVAAALINCFLEQRTQVTLSDIIPPHKDIQPLSDIGISSVSEGSGDDAAVRKALSSFQDSPIPGPSGIVHSTPGPFPHKRKIEADTPVETKRAAYLTTPVRGRKKIGRVLVEDWSSSEFESLLDPDYDPDDPTFQPTDFDISIAQSEDDRNSNISEHGLEQDVFDIFDGEEEDAEQVLEGVTRLNRVTEANVRVTKFMISETELDKILKWCPHKTCSACGGHTSIVKKKEGATLVVVWRCSSGHEVYKWASSPQLPNGVFLLNLLASAAVVVSGNNFNKIKLMMNFLNVAFPSCTSFSRVQNKCVVPVVDRYWEEVRATNTEEHRATSIVVSGDGRMDSPGFCAKYCTYTMMEQTNKTILALEIIDKRETNLNSCAMETVGFRRALSVLKNEGVTCKEVVTDAHPQISAIMRKQYPNVKHSYDMWHGGKNLGKKLTNVASTKGNESLRPWIQDITNHFFYSADRCQGIAWNLKLKWVSVLKHVTNTHTWALGECDHGDIQRTPEEEEEKPWLQPASKTVKDLQAVVTDSRLLKNMSYYTTCQTTSELEMFNNHLLMYAPKRNAFSYAVYRCRCQLAAIDYSNHLKRPQKIKADGIPRVKRVYSKAANNWSVVPVKVPKDYNYVPDLLCQIANQYVDTRKERPLTGKAIRVAGDPVSIASTIAKKAPPPTAVLRQKQQARIAKAVLEN